MARRLTGNLRSTDLLARLGGDEFLIGLTGLDPQRAFAESVPVAEELAAVIGRPVDVAGEQVRVTASIGISTSPGDAEDFGRLFHLADMRMYELKHPQVDSSTAWRHGTGAAR